jgi:hypothetical protein
VIYDHFNRVGHPLVDPSTVEVKADLAQAGRRGNISSGANFGNPRAIGEVLVVGPRRAISDSFIPRIGTFVSFEVRNRTSG